jgi:hypothetical protein
VSVRQFLPPLQETALFSMSVKIMSDVFENSKTEGNARLVLLCLADCANDEGVCWPSIKTLSRKANISEETTRKFLHVFEKIGLVESEERFNPLGRRTSNTYKINLEKIGDDKLTKDVIYLAIPKSKQRTGDGMNQFIPQPPNPVHTYHPLNQFIPSIMNHQKEPKKEPSSDSAIAPSNSSIENEELFTMKVAESPSAPKPRKAKPVDDQFIAELKTLNPEINIDAELRKMDTWLLAHPERKKTRPFVTGWINRQSSKLIESKKDTRLPNGEIDWANVKPNM